MGNFGERRHHARHGYALTGHVSQGESVDRTFVLASPERGGAEWAYVAGSRQRHDLQVFVTHHEAENVEAALARAWSRSQAKSLALDVVDLADRGSAMDAVRGDLDAATPERLIARAEKLRAARQAAREAAVVPGHELARVAELRAAMRRAETGVAEAESREVRLSEHSRDCLCGGAARERKPARPSSRPTEIRSTIWPTPEPRQPSWRVSGRRSIGHMGQSVPALRRARWASSSPPSRGASTPGRAEIRRFALDRRSTALAIEPASSATWGAIGSA